MFSVLLLCCHYEFMLLSATALPFSCEGERESHSTTALFKPSDTDIIVARVVIVVVVVVVAAVS